MAAHAKVSAQQIANALLHWRGNVQAAAAALGLSRHGLYKRIVSLRMDLAGFRRASKVVAPFATNIVAGTTVATTIERPEKTSGHFRGAGRRPTFRAVETEASVDLPIKTAPRRPTPLRLADPQRERLQRAAWILQARFQAATDENLILEQFIDERFEEWLSGKLKASQPRAKKRGGDE